MVPSCLKNKAGPQMTDCNRVRLSTCQQRSANLEEAEIQPGWKWLGALTLDSMAPSATPSSHLINSPDLHYSVRRMGEVTAAVARNCVNTQVSILPLPFTSCVASVSSSLKEGSLTGTVFYGSNQRIISKGFDHVTFTLRTLLPRNTLLGPL